jgi:spermidine synthase
MSPGDWRPLGIETRTLSGMYPWEASKERLAQLAEAAGVFAPINTDTSPYLMRLAFQQWFRRYDTSPVWVYGFLAVICGVYLLKSRSMETVLFSTGFAAMGLQMLVVFAFQIFYGYVYLQIGAIVTAFLVGLIPGAWVGTRMGRNRLRRLVFSEMGVIALTLGFAGALYTVGGVLPPAGYLAFGCTVAMVCGFQFPLILTLMGKDAHAAGRAFAADLAGAGAGALTTSMVLLPMTGLYGLTAGLVMVKLVSLARLLASGKGP